MLSLCRLFRGHQIQATNGGGIIVASTTFQPGVQITLDKTLTLVGENQIIVASSTISLSPPSADPVITLINGNVMSAGGKAATVDGKKIALAPKSNALEFIGIKPPLPLSLVATLAVAGQTFTAGPIGFAIGGQIVTPGTSAVTFAGSVFSLASGSNSLVVNGRTTPPPSESVHFHSRVPDVCRCSH